MKKYFSALLLIAQILLFVSCAQETPDSTDTVPGDTSEPVSDETTGDPSRISNLPDKYDLGGYNFRVIKQAQDKIAWSMNTFAPDGENGEILNDTIYKRNQTVSEKYNFKITEISVDSDPLARVNQSVLAGDDEYDIALIQLRYISGALTGNFMNVYDVPNIDTDKAWWDQNLLRDLTIKDKLYVLNGDILVSDNDSMMMTMYNRPLADDYNIENLYEAVREGRWTYDLMFKYAKLVSNDLDGNSVYDMSDRYGLMYVNNSAAEPYFASTNTYLYQMKDGIPVYTANSERAHDVFELMNTVLADNSVAFDWSKISGDIAASKIAEMIGNKQILFQNMVLSFVRRNYREIELDFGLLPLPKLNEEQQNYSTNINLSTPYLYIPVSVEEIEKCGFITEALAVVSSQVTDTYYSVCMESKYTRDVESYEMIKLAAKNIVYDPGFIFDWGKIGTNVRSSIMTSGGNYASLIAAYETISKTEMNKFIDEIN